MLTLNMCNTNMKANIFNIFLRINLNRNRVFTLCLHLYYIKNIPSKVSISSVRVDIISYKYSIM